MKVGEVQSDDAEPGTDAEVVTIERLPEDVLDVVLLRVGDRGVLRFACVSHAARAIAAREELWEQLLLCRWPHVNKVLAAVRDAHFSLVEKLLPSHLRTANTHGAPRAFHRARVLCGSSAQLLCDEAIAQCQTLLSTPSIVAADLRALGAVLHHINEAGLQARTAPEYRAFLWLLGPMLLDPKVQTALVKLAVSVESLLDKWYTAVEEGASTPEANQQLLLSAFHGRSTVESVLTVLRAMQYDHARMRNPPPDLLGIERARRQAGANWSDIEALAAAALRVNRSILSMRSEGCDLSIPTSYRPGIASKASAWWWFLEAPMHVSGGNPYVLPTPHWMDSQLTGRPASEAAVPWDPIRWV